MRITMKALLLTLVFAVATSTASAALLTETFDTDPTPRGWIADGPAYHATGGNDGGYYSGTRSGAYPWVGMALGGMDIGATFGTDLAATIDAKRFAGTGAPGISWEVLSSGTSWTYSFGVEPATEWTNYGAAIDTTWTDGEANANGWTMKYGSASFSAVVASVDYLLFTQPVGGQNPGTSTIGVDNFELIPEPATMSLLATGGVFALIRRKKK